MDVERNEVGNVTVLRLAGDIDDGGVGALRTAMYGCAKDARFNVVMNMGEVGFISYMGVGVMVERLRKMRSLGGDVKLVGLNVYAQRLFRMVGVTSLFESYDTEGQAVSVFQEAA